MIVGHNIRRIREEQGLSQAALSERTREGGLESFYPTTIARIEAGVRALRVAELPSVAQALDVNPEALLESRVSSNARRLADIQAQLQETAVRIRVARQELDNLAVIARGKNQEIAEWENRAAALRRESESLMAAGVDLTEHISLVRAEPEEETADHKR
ncbi:helix-turn-helix domain-containing protein [Gryllotalpicola reticulitermitis]|uniref:Helix-turn-helix domain-containing protein n=1 Tax=Gryllotalpicola reticulitermitis TaxID=1184153 RepID=A0ABV8QBJ3_9MICO